MLEISQLRYQYPATDEAAGISMCFDFTAAHGEILSLIGPSGSGKSSLLNLIAGFITPDSGTVSMDGQPFQQLPPSRRPLSMVFQSHNLFPHLDVYTNIALGLDASLKLGAEQHQDIENALQKLGLAGLGKRKPGQLSGGQQQRVAIARALVRRQPLLLLDEPFAALGPALRDEMIDLLKQLVIDRNMVAILVSHHPQDARRASQNTAFVHQGHVIEIAPTEALLGGLQRSEIREYLGAM